MQQSKKHRYCHSRLQDIRLSTHLLLTASSPFVLLFAAPRVRRGSFRVYAEVVSATTTFAGSLAKMRGGRLQQRPTRQRYGTHTAASASNTQWARRARGTNEPSMHAYSACTCSAHANSVHAHAPNYKQGHVRIAQQ